MLDGGCKVNRLLVVWERYSDDSSAGRPADFDIQMSAGIIVCGWPGVEIRLGGVVGHGFPPGSTRHLRRLRTTIDPSFRAVPKFSPPRSSDGWEAKKGAPG